ncbi:hypothetical protein AI2916V1_4537 (plasmid) [Enterobacter cloacae]|nr:hypothetical protein AI2916V1_4537 [Enterobacter cloacae]
MKKLLGAALLCSALTGCAGLNSDFDCNKTATDQCLTTGEANKLDTDDNFHQPAVVEFVKNKSHWDEESYRVIGEGGE